ncbi:small multi-drug export protein [Candidatus Peregrinibacteria bacterium]|jgi:uncharacterized membrane protein|nr:small multi-drug export protein [Candidatus Peregrinibacteria bacterium]
MSEFFIHLFESINPHLAIFTMSTLPIIELRGSIPVGILGYDLPIIEVVALAIVGNMFPNFFILKFLEPLKNFFTAHSKIIERIYNHIVEKTQSKHSEKFLAVGAIFLVSFVAIPLPGSGSWTGCLIAYLFKVPYWKALGLIFLGILGGTAVVTTLSVGTDAIFGAIVNLF